MSKISDLAKTFEQTSRTEAASIEQQTKADLETLRKNINEALKQSEQKNNRRYKRSAVTHEQGSIQALSVELARYIGGRVDSHSRAVHSDMERQER
ncbi:MbeB family mobilization protein, partial [Neisseria gonorrhoeae]|uniref:MbeB family mobilization protein n=1 Tax=Neisseria gonorrhoeae TaxID=485 RepID=UPI00201D9775